MTPRHGLADRSRGRTQVGTRRSAAVPRWVGAFPACLPGLACSADWTVPPAGRWVQPGRAHGARSSAAGRKSGRSLGASRLANLPVDCPRAVNRLRVLSPCRRSRWGQWSWPWRPATDSLARLANWTGGRRCRCCRTARCCPTRAKPSAPRPSSRSHPASTPKPGPFPASPAPSPWSSRQRSPPPWPPCPHRCARWRWPHRPDPWRPGRTHRRCLSSRRCSASPLPRHGVGCSDWRSARPATRRSRRSSRRRGPR